MDVSKHPLREFLEIPYEKLEELNLQSKDHQEQWISMEQAERRAPRPTWSRKSASRP